MDIAKLTGKEVREATALIDLLQKRERYRKNPLDYLTERLNIPPETIDWNRLPEYKNHRWDGTENPLMEILNSVFRFQWTGVESAIGVGKTFLGACIGLCFLEIFPKSMVVTTAPKEDQLTLHIWKEIQELYGRFGLGQLDTLRLRMKPPFNKWMMTGFVAGANTTEESATKAQGFHAEYMLFILEETPGIRPEVITALRNTCTSPTNVILAFGNPDNQQDQLHKFCKMPSVNHVRISALDHPNVVTKNPKFIAGAQTEMGLQKLKEAYIDALNPTFLSRSRGISPKSSVDALIKQEWVFEAVERWKMRAMQNAVDLDNIRHPVRAQELEKVFGIQAIGNDVANSVAGDKAAIAHGFGSWLWYVEDFHCDDANRLGRKLSMMMDEYHIDERHVGVDGVGVGAGTVNALKELDKNVVDIQSAEKQLESAMNEAGIQMIETFKNLRCQMWWQARLDIVYTDLAIPDDQELIEDLTIPKWEPKNGKIYIEEKEEIKKRLGRSTNKGDAFVYWNWVRKSRYLSAAIGNAVQEKEINPVDSMRATRRRSF